MRGFAYIEAIIFTAEAIEEKMSIDLVIPMFSTQGRHAICRTYLRFDQNQINEKHNKVMLDVFVGKSFATWTLRETNAFAKCTVVSLTVCCIQRLDGISASKHKLVFYLGFFNSHSLQRQT